MPHHRPIFSLLLAFCRDRSQSPCNGGSSACTYDPDTRCCGQEADLRSRRAGRGGCSRGSPRDVTDGGDDGFGGIAAPHRPPPIHALRQDPLHEVLYALLQDLTPLALTPLAQWRTVGIHFPVLDGGFEAAARSANGDVSGGGITGAKGSLRAAASPSESRSGRAGR